MTGVALAVHHEEFDLAKRLVDKGARADAKTRYGVTPLFLACQNGMQSWSNYFWLQVPIQILLCPMAKLS